MKKKPAAANVDEQISPLRGEEEVSPPPETDPAGEVRGPLDAAASDSSRETWLIAPEAPGSSSWLAQLWKRVRSWIYAWYQRLSRSQPTSAETAGDPSPFLSLGDRLGRSSSDRAGFPPARDETPPFPSLPPPPATAGSGPSLEPPPSQAAVSREEFLQVREQMGRLDSWRQWQEEVGNELVAQNKLLRRHLEERESEINRARSLIETAENRTRELESLLRRAREEAQAQMAEQEVRFRAEAEHNRELDAGRESQHQQSIASLEAQIQKLSQDLEAKEKQVEAARQVSGSEAQKAREETRRALAQVRDLEAALSTASSRLVEIDAELASQKAVVQQLRLQAASGGATSERPSAPSSPARPAAPAGEERPSSPKQVQFYQQAVTPLTILSASIDLLLMNPKLDAELRDLATDLKQQSTKLVDLFKDLAPSSPSKGSGS